MYKEAGGQELLSPHLPVRSDAGLKKIAVAAFYIKYDILRTEKKQRNYQHKGQQSRTRHYRQQSIDNQTKSPHVRK